MKRENILEKIIEEQQEVIDSLRNSVERYKNASDIDEDDTLDPEDFSQQTQAKDMQLRYEKMLREATGVMSFLSEEIKNNHKEIENGSLIETNEKWLFVGVSVPTFKIDGKEVLSFSDDAPIFQNLKGKKVGDEISIGENKLKIISIN